MQNLNVQTGCGNTALSSNHGQIGFCLPCCPVDEAESLRDVGVDAGDLLPAADAPGDDADLNVNVIAA